MILERLPEVLKLTKAEQAELYSELGDLLARDDAWDQLTPEVIAELDRRMEEYRLDPCTGRTWEEVKAKAANVQTPLVIERPRR
ncbi:MAG TPA: addiction module protein [Chthoniobacteraceae bacterium]|jgi:putative addiction module component (TIGR02574 family)|nr:addiction module protein [Chthoniobacteraceae bacterium]